MRVIAGVAGGRRLVAPAGRDVRPTSDRVREAVFSSLESMDAVAGARVLDLFAGSGALGIEALSRRATSATFVDVDVVAVDAVRANLEATGLREQASVVRDDALRFLADHADAFDLAFADPPYAFDAWDDLLGQLRADVIVLESDRPPALGARFEVLRTKAYGGTVVTIARPA